MSRSRRGLYRYVLVRHSQITKKILESRDHSDRVGGAEDTILRPWARRFEQSPHAIATYKLTEVSHSLSRRAWLPEL
jgi:hypothetical protein